jgi:hypothetical protein
LKHNHLIVDEPHQRPLTLHDFKGCFAIIISGFVVGVAVFFLEILMNVMVNRK